MIVPNAENAEVDIRKLTEYLLNHEHADGRHKARIYAAALDFYAKDAEDLKRALLIAVKTNEAVFGSINMDSDTLWIFCLSGRQTCDNQE